MRTKFFSPTLISMLAFFWASLITSQAQSVDLVSQNTALQYIPKAVAASLEKSQIPKEAISISVVEIEPGQPGKITSKTNVDWRSKQAILIAFKYKANVRLIKVKIIKLIARLI